MPAKSFAQRRTCNKCKGQAAEIVPRNVSSALTLRLAGHSKLPFHRADAATLREG